MTMTPSAEFRLTSTDGVRVACGRWNGRVTGISHDFYPGGRHEMLNETNRDEVRTRLIGWISWVPEQRKLCTRAS
jgi:hypothetical protein